MPNFRYIRPYSRTIQNAPFLLRYVPARAMYITQYLSVSSDAEWCNWLWFAYIGYAVILSGVLIK